MDDELENYLLEEENNEDLMQLVFDHRTKDRDLTKKQAINIVQWIQFEFDYIKERGFRGN